MSDNNIKSVPAGSKRRRDRVVEVQVVQCPSAFPISTRKRPPPPAGASAIVASAPAQAKQAAEPNFLDWRETAKEVRAFGATAFEGKQKRNFKDEQYKLLTGRSPKKHQVPLPIVRGIRKKAAEREKRKMEEARQAGIIIPKQQTKKKKVDRTSQVYGPAPSIGAVHQGVLKLKGKPK
jgi:Domain of unknown function (DUF4602)